MPLLKLPLWFITEYKGDGQPPEHSPCDEPEAILAFSDFKKLTEFWAARKGARYKVVMANDRDALVVVLADAHASELQLVCLDAAPDGSGGTRVPLTDLIALSTDDSRH